MQGSRRAWTFCEWFGHDITSNPESLELALERSRMPDAQPFDFDSFRCKRCGVGVRDDEASMGRITRALCRWFGHRPFTMRYGLPPMEDWQETCVGSLWGRWRGRRMRSGGLMSLLT